MISKTRLLLTGAAVAIVLIAGGIAFDRHEVRVHSECMDEIRTITESTLFVSGTYHDPPDPEVLTSPVLLTGCEDANWIGLAVAGIGAVLLAAEAIVWWTQRRSVGPARK
ncbi:hypothetical protein [Rhodococcus sp. SGAir0479]|uniref:hypothetical protein n=1 Tax=Rhodococcus sp. SGAir0479 TaxID=2567884 RepID=UPI0010CCCD63|nr:hypothetical protein [Rhodococcus sp. SGAir0479]QCQ91156.1 hypothetical protein E7742_07825 [Rhodococcus sp. SGAir0479]